MLNKQSQQALRILDANANRAAEGLRTIEDVARLVCEDRTAAEWMKHLRHKLAAACQQFPRAERLLARAVETDAGTEISVRSETRRNDVAAIVSAAAERITQSLRCLEEFSKIIEEPLSQPFKELRYEAYDVLARTELRLSELRPRFSGTLYLLIDCSKDLSDFVAYVRELAEAGVDCFQIRDKRAEGCELVRYSRAAVDALKDTQAQLFVNDRIDVALAAGATGVHLGQEDMSLLDAQKITAGRLLIGISTHNLAQALAAQRDGADYIGCGPTFPSQTKRFAEFAGVEFLQAVAAQASIPAVAIGGIDLENLPSVLAAGGRRIAVSGVINASPSPAATAGRLKETLTGVQ